MIAQYRGQRGAVGWAKRSVPTMEANGFKQMVGTLRFAHPTRL